MPQCWGNVSGKLTPAPSCKVHVHFLGCPLDALKVDCAFQQSSVVAHKIAAWTCSINQYVQTWLQHDHNWPLCSRTRPCRLLKLIGWRPISGKPSTWLGTCTNTKKKAQDCEKTIGKSNIYIMSIIDCGMLIIMKNQTSSEWNATPMRLKINYDVHETCFACCKILQRQCGSNIMRPRKWGKLVVWSHNPSTKMWWKSAHAGHKRTCTQGWWNVVSSRRHTRNMKLAKSGPHRPHCSTSAW